MKVYELDENIPLDKIIETYYNICTNNPFNLITNNCHTWAEMLL